MKKRVPFFVLVLILAGINAGTIRRTEDPIRDTQTDAIAYQQKMEEEKDGVKGPLAYSVKYNPNDTFFVDPPIDDKEKPAGVKDNGKVEKPPALSDWWEEKPVPGASISSKNETVEESGVAEERGPASPGESADKAGSSSTPGKGTSNSDYWW